MSAERMARYAAAFGGDTRKALTLYRKNLALSQEMFTVLSCFEVALRNRIHRVYAQAYGDHWLRDFVQPGGRFDRPDCKGTLDIVRAAYAFLRNHKIYAPGKLVAELQLGTWRYLFSQAQFKAGGQILLAAFPNKPTSTPTVNYNHTYIFQELKQINNLRNRLAHHEPVCFLHRQAVKDTQYARTEYWRTRRLFQYMGIDEARLLYGLDHILHVCDEIDRL